MTKFLNKRNLLLTGAVSAVLIGGLSVIAVADLDDRERDITLEAMLEKAEKRFDTIDADGDGLVTQAEAEAARSERHGKRGAYEGDSDGDGDGDGDSDGYGYSYGYGDDDAEDPLARRFERMDENGDGLLSSGERGYDRVSERLGLSGDITLAQIEAARETAKAERAAEFPLTREAVREKTTQKFAELDTNGDGILTSEERPKKHRYDS